MHNKSIGIIDYGIGNLYSIEKALTYLGHKVTYVKHYEEILRSDFIILPGVGAFDKCYNMLKNIGFIEYIMQHITRGKPFLGICVGMQLLFTSSTEGKHSPGFNVIKGSVELINSNTRLVKVPHIGWRSLELNDNQTNRLFSGITSDDKFYFVHSYNAQIKEQDVKMIISEYEDIKITAFVEKGNVFGCQFHPEKSRAAGLRVLNNFLAI